MLFLDQLESFPESLRHVLGRYDVVKLGVAVAEDGHKLLNDFGVKVNGAADLRFLVQRYYPGNYFPDPGSIFSITSSTLT